MGRSPGFGSTLTNFAPSSDSLSLRLRVFPLTSLVNVTRRPVLQKVRHQALTPSDCLWAFGFRFFFTPLPGCFSPFPHGTRALSVAKEYLALEGGPPGFPRDSSCPVVLGVLPESFRPFRIRGFYPLRPDFPVLFSYSLRSRGVSATTPGSPATPYAQRLQPSPCIRFGLFPFRSPLLGESRLLSFPRGTKMFQFPRFAPLAYVFS